MLDGMRVPLAKLAQPRVGAILLGLLAASAGIGLATVGAAPLLYLGPVALGVAACVLLWLTRERAGPRSFFVALDLARLHEGRLHDYLLRAVGYRRQFEGLAETFPTAPVREALRQGMPRISATIRELYHLCLAVQSFEIGESRPPALMGAAPDLVGGLTASTEEVIRATLSRFGDLYTTIRAGWSTAQVDLSTVALLFDEIEQSADHLRECSIIFSGTLAEQPSFLDPGSQLHRPASLDGKPTPAG